MNEANTYGRIIEAEIIPFGFEAPGWQFLFWGLIVLFSILFIALSILYYKRRYRRQAVKQIALLSITKNRNQTIQAINTILKQLAMSYYDREKVARLDGAEWVHFLNRSSRKPYFNKEEAQYIFEASYNHKLSINDILWQTFIQSCTQWIKHYGI